MSNSLIDTVSFEDLEDELKVRCRDQFSEDAKAWASSLLEEHFNEIASLVMMGLDAFGRGIVMCHLLEKEDSDGYLAKYRYVPMKDFIEAEAQNGGDCYGVAVDWLVDYNPNTEILFGVWRGFANSIVTFETLKIGTIPDMACFSKIPLKAQVQEFEGIFNESSVASTVKKKPTKQLERKLELDLYNWLRLHGVEVERQVKTSTKHRLDLWIPGNIMLELKAGKVNAEDLCQAIDYQSTYGMPILLVGSGMTTGASRGMAGFNAATGDDNLRFVTWNVVKTYLKGLLGLALIGEAG